jgi:hypothetical protein
MSSLQKCVPFVSIFSPVAHSCPLFPISPCDLIYDLLTLTHNSSVGLLKWIWRAGEVELKLCGWPGSVTRSRSGKDKTKYPIFWILRSSSLTGIRPHTNTSQAGIGTDGGILDSEDPDEDWDQEPPEIKETGTLELDSINWDDINDEVEAAMNESEDDDGDGDAKSERSYDMQSGHGSEEEWNDGNSVSGSVVLNINSLFI